MLTLFSMVLLALALSLDSLTVGLLYGVRGIRLSWSAMLIVGTATGVLLFLAMEAGRMVAAQIHPVLAQRAGAVLLVLVGVWITYNTWRQNRKEQTIHPYKENATPAGPVRVWRVRLAALGVVVEILRDVRAADVDRSGHISPIEACFLGVALAMDSTAAGLSAAMAGFSSIGLPVMAACASLLLMLLGSRAAGWVPVKLEGRWGAIHGVVLVLLGLYRMSI